MLQAQPSAGDFINSNNIMVKRGRSLFTLIFEKRRIAKSDDFSMNKQEGATLFHALVVIFLEYFAWGLLTVPVINVSCYIYSFL